MPTGVAEIARQCRAGSEAWHVNHEPCGELRTGLPDAQGVEVEERATARILRLVGGLLRDEDRHRRVALRSFRHCVQQRQFLRAQDVGPERGVERVVRSTSSPSPSQSAAGPTTARQVRPAWVMAPVTPAGQPGARSGRCGIAAGAIPSAAIAARAARRPAANSARRAGRASTRRSPGQRSPGGSSGSAEASAVPSGRTARNAASSAA